MWDIKSRLRKEISVNSSGSLLNFNLIPQLKKCNYHVKSFPLDGDAPKEFIRAYIYEEDSSIRKINTRTWPSYIAKTAEKWYPHESVIEYMINRIGQVLQLNMNNVKLVRANGQIRFLSEYFMNADEQLIHGADICGEHLEDMPLAEQIANDISTARELFTFQFVKEAITEVFPSAYPDILIAFIKMLTFDALTGNNDRHFYNWGVIANKKKNKQIPMFSPVFDSARGLLWNWSDVNIVRQKESAILGGRKVERYIEDASPRISLENNKKANHFELIGFIKNDNPLYKKIVNELSSEENENKVLKMLNKEFYLFFIKERKDLTTYVLNHRFKKIRRL